MISNSHIWFVTDEGNMANLFLWLLSAQDTYLCSHSAIKSLSGLEIRQIVPLSQIEKENALLFHSINTARAFMNTNLSYGKSRA